MEKGFSSGLRCCGITHSKVLYQNKLNIDITLTLMFPLVLISSCNNPYCRTATPCKSYVTTVITTGATM